jgi:hypothetical protein
VTVRSRFLYAKPQGENEEPGAVNVAVVKAVEKARAAGRWI